MFHAYRNSEDAEQLQILRALFEQPGLQMFPFVEVPLNTNLFHVDVAPVNEESRWQRFVFDKIKDVFEFSIQEDIQLFRIYVQTKRRSDLDYQLKRVVEISIVDFASGECVFVFLCADGSNEIDSFADLSQAKIIKSRQFWIEPKIEK